MMKPESVNDCFFFFSSRRRHTRLQGDWSSDVCSSDLRNFFIALDGLLRFYERVVPQGLRKKAIARAAQWMLKRMEGDGGLGAIYPAMANSGLALRCLGDEVDHLLGRKGVRKIEALEGHE